MINKLHQYPLVFLLLFCFWYYILLIYIYHTKEEKTWFIALDSFSEMYRLSEMNPTIKQLFQVSYIERFLLDVRFDLLIVGFFHMFNLTISNFRKIKWQSHFLSTQSFKKRIFFSLNYFYSNLKLKDIFAYQGIKIEICGIFTNIIAKKF